MVHILGVLLRDNSFVKIALTRFYGIGYPTAERICARFQIHDRCKIKSLTPSQITSLASFLASPSTTPLMPILPLASPDYEPPKSTPPTPQMLKRDEVSERRKRDPLVGLKIETELRRQIRENIAHHRMIGSYVGRRHAMGMPVRGQNTRNNAQNARKFNKIERRG
ncbi:mitochondrial 30S ribosomal protein S13 [Sistotremastrum suecicum HHB10207 ss-3]|uniref:Mitochondrial 30S ribosomal protein S13 n=1 Tax=Sistotremastrum suecicum HHB10207 ss-3 TaxID=1314776 RepID=A0A166FPW9_9AGAM|nr:mitochondrial 30S ribosomal protein S13 [Sistotremastrum suecicum HHB10207 ss-3]